MTRADALDRYLRYLGEATVNGSTKDDRDLRDQFEHLLPAALLHLAATFPLRRAVDCDGEFPIPPDFLSIESILRDGRQIPYRREGDERYSFEGAARVTYRRTPAPVTDGAALDCAPGCGELAPLCCALMAATGSEDHAFKVPYLSTLFNTMAAALKGGDAPRFERAFSIGGI